MCKLRSDRFEPIFGILSCFLVGLACSHVFKLKAVQVMHAHVDGGVYQQQQKGVTSRIGIINSNKHPDAGQ